MASLNFEAEEKAPAIGINYGMLENPTDAKAAE